MERLLSHEDIVRATGAQVMGPVSTAGFRGVFSDSRKPHPHKLFIALKGDAFDGHDYIESCYTQGCAGFLVHRPNPELAQSTQYVVPDTLMALQDLARYCRQKWNPRVIALTGSNGKTTTKEILGTLLSTHFSSYANKGSLNNHWGVPLSILEFPEECTHLVLEMGMNHAGELRNLVEMAQPEYIMVTMVGSAHIEHFGTQEAIADAKAEIYKYSAKSACGIYNLDNVFTKKMFDADATLKAKHVCFSSHFQTKADVCLELQKATMEGLFVSGQIGGCAGEALVPLFGEHNLTNIMAAAAGAFAMGVPAEKIWSGLSKVPTAWGRNQLLKTEAGARILFDGYNANPESMRALISNVKSLGTPVRVGVFGQMKELGASSAAAHEELGRWVSELNLQVVWFLGIDVEHFKNGFSGKSLSLQEGFFSKDYQQDIASKIAAMLTSEDLVVVKGSRGMELERFVKECHPLNFEGK